LIQSDSAQRHSGQGDWYAIYTRHQHEKTVADNLTKNGIEVFLPTYGVVRQWKDRKKHLQLPLFPSYLFLHGGLERRVKILSTPGVYSFVSVGGQPAAILETEIEAIRRAVTSGLAAEPFPFLQCGDRVRVKAGPLSGIEGILIRKKSSFRLILSAELLQKSIAVEVDAFHVEPVDPRISAGAPAATPNLPLVGYEIGDRAVLPEIAIR
jgi:transcription termination/antitermination protein NusG